MLVNFNVSELEPNVEKEKDNHSYFDEKDFEEIQYHVVFKNCVYDILSGEKLEFDSNKPYYMEINCNYTEKIFRKEPEAFSKLIKDATGDEVSCDMVKYMIGSLIIQKRQKHFWVMAPAPDSGKSLLGTWITSLFEPNRVFQIDVDKIASRFCLQSAANKVLMTSLEMDTAELDTKVVNRLKKLTGEKTASFEAKYKSEITTDIRFKILLASNAAVRPKQMDRAFENRCIIIPFVNSAKKIDDSLGQKLQKEKDSIISMIVEEMPRIIDKNTGTIHFIESEKSLELKKQWFSYVDLIQQFLVEKCEVTGEKIDNESKEEVYSEYRKYCLESKKNNVQNYTKKEFIDKLLNDNCQIYVDRPKKDYRGNRYKDKRRLCGIKLKKNINDVAQYNEYDAMKNIVRLL